MNYQQTLASMLLVAPAVAQLNLAAETIDGPAVLSASTAAIYRTTIRNTGPAISGRTDVAIYLSTDGTITTDDTLLARSRLPPLAKDASVKSSVVVKIPNSSTTGDCHIGLFVDPFAQIAETDETDNIVTKAVRCLSLPDLEPIFLSTPPSLARGRRHTTSIVLANRGGSAATNFRVGLYLSRDAVFDAADMRLASKSVPTIEGETELALTNVEFEIHEDTTSGELFLLAVADDSRRIREMSESNNVLSKTTRVFAPGAITVFGTSCTGTNGHPTLSARVLGNAQPEPGSTIEYGLANAPRRAPFLFVLGLSKRFWGGLRLPFPFPGTTCLQLIRVDAVDVLTSDGAGRAKFELKIPPFAELTGASYFTQAVTIDPKANAIGRAYSHGIETRIGGS